MYIIGYMGIFVFFVQILGISKMTTNLVTSFYFFSSPFEQFIEDEDVLGSLVLD